MLTLRPYQEEAISGVFEWVANNTGNPLIVLPTGSGKSLVCAKITEDALAWPQTRVLQLTHVKELVLQNAKALLRLWPEAPAGIYCAGLSKKQYHQAVIIASIQSVAKKAELIGWRDLIIIDEVHLLGDDEGSIYRKFLAHMRMINPAVVIIGLSATPYRLKSGYLHKGADAMFHGIAYELPVGRLVKEGYLAPLVGKRADTHGQTDHLGLQAGEFAMKEMVSEFDREVMTKAAVNEMLDKGADRRKWLIFCVSIEHGEHILEELVARGVDAAMVSGKTAPGERDRVKREFEAGSIRAVVNVAVWTTGLDVVAIDMIVLLRPTMSPGLLVQMLGRGMRPMYDPGSDLTTIEGRLAGMAAGPKPNCFVLDMANNLERHGPITHIVPPTGRRGEKTDRNGKICTGCKSVNALNATECVDCGKIFEGRPRVVKHSLRASSADVMSDQPVISDLPVWINVRRITFNIHSKVGSPSSLRVTYDCKPNYVSEYLGFAHPKEFVRKMASSWWKARGGSLPAPTTAGEAFTRLKEIEDKFTAAVQVKKNSKYVNVVRAEVVPMKTKIDIVEGNLGVTAHQFMEKENADTTPEAINSAAS